MPRQAILFLIDTQGTNCVGCYAGNSTLGTANLDRLASQGIRFANAYCCAPVCGPARSAIFTGLFPHSNGVLANDLSPHVDIPTLGKRVSDAGLKACYIGKWHLDGTDYFGDGRCPPGWDPEFWFDGRNYLESLRDDAERDLSRKHLAPAEVARLSITAEFTHAHRIAERARGFVLKHREDDFLLVVSIDEPHDPAISPEPFCSGFEDFLLPVPNADDPLDGKPALQRAWAGAAQMWRSPHMTRVDGKAFYRNPRHFACNSFSDYEVSRVLAAIDEHVPEALVVYTADHGDMFGSHQLGGKGPAMYEEITHVPLIVRWPGKAMPGAVSASLASHVDLTPTFLDFFGIAIPPLLHGKSLLDQFRNAEAGGAGAVFMEFHRYEVDHDGFGSFAPIRCVFDGRYKLAINLLDLDELYDLKTDRAELHNLIENPETAEIRDRLHRRLCEWMSQSRDPLRGPQWARRTWGGWEEAAYGGPTRPRPFDEAYFPKTLLYETGREISTFTYDKK